MEVLWRLFKPPLAKNLKQLESQVGAKQLASRFDAIKWTTRASVQDLERLRWSLVNLHDTINSPDIEVNERLKV